MPEPAESEVFIHPQALCESSNIGKGTRIWAFAHVLPGAVVGENCNICDGVFVENHVKIGNNVTIKCGVQIWEGVTVQDDVFIGPNATFTNDRFPRSRVWQELVLETLVEEGASLGANCTILPGLRIGRYAMVGAGAVVTRDVPPFAIVVGNPARITGYVGVADARSPNGFDAVRTTPGGIGECQVINLPHVRDMRGELTVAEFTDLPFVPVRQFVVTKTSGRVRGEHSHRECSQLLICVNGSMKVLVDNGKVRGSVHLDNPHVGLLVPPWIWAAQYEFSADAVLAVFASHPYDADDYIREYETFLAELLLRP
jgi:UDP-2-acetamido-3-amino-2,3-dideoxy-glucuronate N-acetyltransferase